MSKKTKEQAPVAAKKTKREEFSEHKAAALEQLDLAVKDGALFFHTKKDPIQYYRMAANDAGVYGLLNRATGADLMPEEQNQLLAGLTRHCMDPNVFEDYNATEAAPNFILFKNGVFDINEKKFKGNDESLSRLLKDSHQIFTSYIPHAYDPSVVNELDKEVVDRFFDSLAAGDHDVKAVLYEVVGYTFYRSCKFKKGLLLKGAANCGKSTFLAMVKNILGDSNTTALSFKGLSDKFSTIELAGKMANIGDELDKEYITSTSNFKTIVSGHAISGQKKFGDVVTFRPYAKMLFAMNGDIRIDDPGNAVADRFIQIPFPASIRPEDQDRNLAEKLSTPGAVQYVIENAISALIDLLDRNGFTFSDVAEKAKREWMQYNNPIMAWYEEYTSAGNSVVGKVDGELLFNEFNPWVKDQQMRVSYSLPNFRQELMALVPGLKVGTRTRYREVFEEGYYGKEKWGYKMVLDSIGGDAPVASTKDAKTVDAKNVDAKNIDFPYSAPSKGGAAGSTASACERAASAYESTQKELTLQVAEYVTREEEERPPVAESVSLSSESARQLYNSMYAAVGSTYPSRLNDGLDDEEEDIEF